MQRRRLALVPIAVFLFSCGGGSAAPTPPTTTAASATIEVEDAIPGIGSPCDIADVTMVEQAFETLGASVDRGLEGYARNCTYWLGAGTKVDVFYVGTVDRWEEIKSDWDAKEEGGIVEVEGVGDGAYQPTQYHGGRDLVFLVGEHIFSIVAFAGADEASLAKVEKAVLDLASAIVAENS